MSALGIREVIFKVSLCLLGFLTIGRLLLGKQQIFLLELLENLVPGTKKWLDFVDDLDLDPGFL